MYSILNLMKDLTLFSVKFLTNISKTILVFVVTLISYITDYRIDGSFSRIIPNNFKIKTNFSLIPNREEHTIWTQTSNQLALLHHSTSNLDSDDVKYGINFNTQRISRGFPLI